MLSPPFSQIFRCFGTVGGLIFKKISYQVPTPKLVKLTFFIEVFDLIFYNRFQTSTSSPSSPAKKKSSWNANFAKRIFCLFTSSVIFLNIWSQSPVIIEWKKPWKFNFLAFFLLPIWKFQEVTNKELCIHHS